MRKKIFVLLVLFLAVVGYMTFSATFNSGTVSAVEMADTCLTGPGPSIEATVDLAKKTPTFNAIAFIAGHGGHVAVVDMRTMKSPTDLETGRVVITEAGTEMEGKIAGMSFEEVKKAGGTHGQALVTEGGKKVLVVGTLSGDVYKVDLATGKKSGPYKVGEKFCGAIVHDGKVYLEDMANGNVYEWDYKKLKTVDTMPIGKAVCGIQWTKNNEKAYVTDMPTGTVYVIDWKTKKTIKEITSPEMTFIHQARMTPDGKYLFVSAPNEYDPGLKPPTHKSQIIVIDTSKDEIVKRIVLPDDVRPHDFAFTKDGKYVFISSRTYGDDSAINVMDLKNAHIVAKVGACAACHKEAGVTVKVDKGSPLLCGIEMDWHPGKTSY